MNTLSAEQSFNHRTTYYETPQVHKTNGAALFLNAMSMPVFQYTSYGGQSVDNMPTNLTNISRFLIILHRAKRTLNNNSTDSHSTDSRLMNSRLADSRLTDSCLTYLRLTDSSHGRPPHDLTPRGLTPHGRPPRHRRIAWKHAREENLKRRDFDKERSCRTWLAASV